MFVTHSDHSGISRIFRILGNIYEIYGEASSSDLINNHSIHGHRILKKRILLLLFCYFFLSQLLRSSPFFNGWFFRNPFLLGDSLPPFDISTRPGRLEKVASRFISNEGLSQILFFMFVTHSDHSEIYGIFSDSW